MGLVIMFVQIAQILLSALWWLIIIQAVLSWLLAFNVINHHSDFVQQIWQVLDKLTEPIYRPIRRHLPDMGGLDLSPLVVLLGIWILQGPVLNYIAYSVAPSYLSTSAL